MIECLGPVFFFRPDSTVPSYLFTGCFPAWTSAIVVGLLASDALENLSVHVDGSAGLPFRVHRSAPRVPSLWRARLDDRQSLQRIRGLDHGRLSHCAGSVRREVAPALNWSG